MIFSIIALEKKKVLKSMEGITDLINAHTFSRETDFV